MFLSGVANASRKCLLLEEAGVLLCFCFSKISSLDLRGVLPTMRLLLSPLLVLIGLAAEGVGGSRRSNSPRTTPSFCGVGPSAFLEGVNRLRACDGVSYGSTSHGCSGAFEGVFEGVLESIWRFEEISTPRGSSLLRFRGVRLVVDVGAGGGYGSLPER